MKTCLLLTLVLIAGITRSQTATNFKLVSSAFAEGKPVPVKYTCDSLNVSPPLSWSGVPEKTKSFAIIMDDPDAPMGTWVHWVAYNIPAAITGIAEQKSMAEVSALDGLNSWGEKGYNGPCPPGGTHQYIFKLYALDNTLALQDGMTSDELMDAMKGHILAEARLTGLFRVQ